MVILHETIKTKNSKAQLQTKIRNDNKNTTKRNPAGNKNHVKKAI